MASHKAACLPHFSTTSTQTTNPEMMSPVDLHVLTTCASRPRSVISIEETLKDTLSGLTTYYEENHLRASTAKTQVCAFQLRNKEAKRQLKVSWCETPLSHSHPTYLRVTLDRCLTFKTHVMKTKAKVSTRNNILRKLTNTRWGACPKTLHATALALIFSTTQYVCPAWERTTRAADHWVPEAH